MNKTWTKNSGKHIFVILNELVQLNRNCWFNNDRTQVNKKRLEICFDDIISNEIQHINANTGFQEMKWGPGNEMWAWGRSYVSIYY